MDARYDPTTPAAVRQALDAYVSRSLPRDLFEEVAPFARDIVRRVAPVSEHAARQHMLEVSTLAAWCVTVGLELETEIVFAPDTIDRFIEGALADRSEAARRTYRPNLRRIARVVAPKLQPPEPERHPRHRSKAPYTSAEIDALFRLADNQPTATHRRRLRALLCLGVGAGLQPGEPQHVARDDIDDANYRFVAVIVRGERERFVPVLEPFGLELASIALACDDYYLLGGHEDSDRRNVVTSLVSRIKGDRDLPGIEVGRLRATWCVHHLRELGVDAFIAAAGLHNTHTLFDVIAQLPEPDDDRITEYLEGWWQ